MKVTLNLETENGTEYNVVEVVHTLPAVAVGEALRTLGVAEAWGFAGDDAEGDEGWALVEANGMMPKWFPLETV